VVESPILGFKWFDFVSWQPQRRRLASANIQREVSLDGRAIAAQGGAAYPCKPPELICRKL